MAIAIRSASAGESVVLDWGAVLCGRADLLGLTRHGRLSANRSCRLLRAADGWVAINLARPDDLESVDALLEEPTDEPWSALERALPALPASHIVARGRLLGLPISELLSVPRGVGHCDGLWLQEMRWAPLSPRSCAGLRVVDCSAMWAGPLAAAILGACGAVVVKVESLSRPDASRETPDFYRWLHPDEQEEVRVDLGSTRGRQQLRALIEGADVVIESSRPRAFEQLGIGPSQVQARPGRVWLSITGYGRSAPARDWVAFGDDAAVAGGLVARDFDGTPVFFGDAIADPITGMVSSLAVLHALRAGGGLLLDVAMAVCAAWVASPPPIVTSTLTRV